MAEKNISTNVHYKPLPILTAYKNLGFKMEDYPNAFYFIFKLYIIVLVLPNINIKLFCCSNGNTFILPASLLLFHCLSHSKSLVYLVISLSIYYMQVLC